MEPNQPPQQPLNPLPVAAPQQKSKLPLIFGLVFVVVVAAVAVLVVMSLNKGKEETRVGKEYIKAIQAKNYDSLGNLVDPDVEKLADKIGVLSNDKAIKQSFYKSFLTSSFQETAAGTGEPQKVSVKLSKSGNDKYAVVVYKVSSKDVTAIETYDGKAPKVLAIQAGKSKVTDSTFKENYKQYKESISTMNTFVDQLAKSAGESEADKAAIIKNIFSEKN